MKNYQLIRTSKNNHHEALAQWNHIPSKEEVIEAEHFTDHALHALLKGSVIIKKHKAYRLRKCNFPLVKAQDEKKPVF